MRKLLITGLLATLSILLAAGFVPAQEKAAKEYKVVAEDELAPVRAIHEAVQARLSKPMPKIDLELIMEGEDFFGATPSALRWDGDGSRFWFSWKKWDEPETGTWEYTMATGALRRLDENEADLVPPGNAAWDRAHSRAIWSFRDSLWIYETAGKTVKPIIERVPGLRPLGYNGDETQFLVMMGDNLHAIALDPAAGPAFRRLTDVRSGMPPREDPPTDSQRYVRQQQLALFDFLSRRVEERKQADERHRAGLPKPFYLQGWRLNGMTPSPDLKSVALQLSKDTPNDRVADMPNYTSESGYTESIPTRTKVGDEPNQVRLVVIDIASGLSADPDFALEKREVTTFALGWNRDSSKLLVMVRARDNKDSWLMAVTPSVTAADEQKPAALALGVQTLASEHDDAWVNSPWRGGMGWLPDGSGIYFLSERTGYMHLYRAGLDGTAQALTTGQFEVRSPEITPDETGFVYQASLPGDPFTVQTFRLPLEGGTPQQLTDGAGRADATLSPDGATLAIAASSSAKPTEIYVRAADGSGLGTQVTDSPSPAYKSYSWIDPPIVWFTARDGVRVPAQIYKPAKQHANRPGIIFVHGAGYMQNVHRWWRGSSYGRVFAFQHLLMERGYTVLDIDYRGSAGYGRDWRTAIYQHMGGKDLTDQVDGVRWLVKEHRIDPTRVGLYGGSYGGFITLMALFLEPDTFAAGASMRPVTDWAAYNHGYTANILNTPVDDPDAYLKSSPIYFAEGLKGALLICHGIMDDNVHFQDSVRLVQRLIELRKENWELAVYPIEPHGFAEPASWVDEYRRILKLFDTNVRDRK